MGPKLNLVQTKEKVMKDKKQKPPMVTASLRQQNRWPINKSKPSQQYVKKVNYARKTEFTETESGSTKKKEKTAHRVNVNAEKPELDIVNIMRPEANTGRLELPVYGNTRLGN